MPTPWQRDLEADGRKFRLIGVGVGDLSEGGAADPPSLLDPEAKHRAEVERAIDAVRAKLGPKAIGKGRGRRSISKPEKNGP